jgi:translation initiation factor IF-3
LQLKCRNRSTFLKKQNSVKTVGSFIGVRIDHEKLPEKEKIRGGNSAGTRVTKTFL